ncbi:MAG: DUF3841 domain-containing protein [Saprospiraceae bacterium]
MLLYTFQSNDAVEVLKTKGILTGDWAYVSKGYWQFSYEWMCRQMEKRGIACQNNPPIWAFHSCEAWSRPPTFLTARALVSDIALESGMTTIVFEAPDDLVLLSSYRIWGGFWSEMDGVTGAIPKRRWGRMFNLKYFKEGDDLQACLPYLRLEWVKEVRPLDLPINKEDPLEVFVSDFDYTAFV